MKKPPSAAELARQLGVTGKTAWLLRRKITHAMRRGEHELLLRGAVELDESLLGAGYLHEPHAEATPQAAGELLPWVHIVISNFKRWQLDVFHGVSAAHLQSYLDELCYRLNRRDARLDLFRRILDRCVLYTPPTTYSQLIARAA
jgi:ISXO2-like transposase domain